MKVLGNLNVDNLENVSMFVLKTNYDNAFESIDEFIHYWLGAAHDKQVCNKESLDEKNFKMDLGHFNNDGNVQVVCSILHKDGMDGEAFLIHNWAMTKFRNFMKSVDFKIEELV